MNDSARASTYDALAYLCTQTLNVTLNVTLEKVPLEKVPLPRLSNGDGRYRSFAVLTHFRVLILQNSPTYFHVWYLSTLLGLKSEF